MATCFSFFEHPLSNRYWQSEITDPKLLCQEWFEKQMWRYANKKGGTNLLIHKISHEIVGWCGLLVQTVDGAEELEVGYSIIPKYWGMGFAPEAAKKCIDHAFANNLADSIISIIQVDNKESIRVAEKNGLAKEKETIYHNNRVYIYRIRKKTR